MENVNLKDGYNFRMLINKTLAVRSGINDVFYCPFCYSQISESEAKCGACGKNFPELIYYHSDDETWIASGNENN